MFMALFKPMCLWQRYKSHSTKSQSEKKFKKYLINLPEVKKKKKINPKPLLGKSVLSLNSWHIFALQSETEIGKLDV